MLDPLIFTLAFPLAYIIFIIFCSVYKPKRPDVFYHCCEATSVTNINNSKLFKTKTEGRAYFSPKENNNLGVKPIKLKYYKRKIIFFLTPKSKKEKLDKIVPPSKTPIANVVFKDKAAALIYPIFQLSKPHHIFNIWGAIKSRRNEWVTTPLHNIILTSCSLDSVGNCVVTDAKLIKKKGWDLWFCRGKVWGMCILNLTIFTAFFSLGILSFIPEALQFFLCTLYFFIICGIIIVIWFIVNLINISL